MRRLYFLFLPTFLFVLWLVLNQSVSAGQVALGLALAARLDEVPGLVGAIRAELKDWDTRSIKDELDLLRRFAGQGKDAVTAPAPKSKSPTVPAGKARTTFQIVRPQGSAKCTAANGRLEIRLPRERQPVRLSARRHKPEQETVK